MKTKAMTERTLTRRCKNASQLLRDINVAKYTGRAPRTRAALKRAILLLDNIASNKGEDSKWRR